MQLVGAGEGPVSAPGSRAAISLELSGQPGVRYNSGSEKHFSPEVIDHFFKMTDISQALSGRPPLSGTVTAQKIDFIEFFVFRRTRLSFGMNVPWDNRK